ncbi:MAG TPA: dihydroneopterin aldolase [Verrucomicrobiae bacterium]|nr:dihydroneopterin aldolase [Verrucomicrobiae bacterium]
MGKIAIVDLEVNYCIGVTDQERANPQKLLLTLELTVDFTAAAMTDRVEKTINYQRVVDDLLQFGQNRSWRLLEKLVSNIADRILTEYEPDSVHVEAKKFVIPQARYVSASLARSRQH